MFSPKRRMADIITQATIQAEIFSRKLSITGPQSVTVQPAPFPEFLTEIGQPDNGRVKVPAGATEVIFDYEMGEGYFGVLRDIAWTYYMGDELQLNVDDSSVYNQPIKWALGEYPNTTVRTLKPFTKRIEMVATNKSSTENHWYGVICKGPIVYLKDQALLLDLVSRGAI
jgi:hypothetical protein